AESSGCIRHIPAHDQNAQTNQNKSKQGSDAGHLSNNSARNKSSKQAYKNHEKQIGFIRRPVLFMGLRKNRRQQTVPTHGVKNPALTQQHNQNDGRVSQKNSYNNGRIQPGVG